MNRNKFFGKLALVCAAAVFSASSTFAQSVTQGAIAATVEDASGAVVPNASVLIHNEGTNADLKLTADSKGYFNAPLLQPGNYTVTITANGFSKYTAAHVVVQVSQLTELHPALGAAGTATEVTVTAATPALNFESPDFNDVIDNHAIVSIPENNRRWSSLAMETPGVVSDANGFGLISVRGISPLLNNVLIDGADDNQAFFSEERGRTREAYSTSEDAVQEFTVNTGVYPAEFGRSAGAVINSVTKSGTNKLHGEAYFYDRESGFAAFTPLSTNAVPNGAGGYTNVPIKPKDLRKIYGFSAGGALLKDKIFWYYTFDQHNRHFPGIGRPSNPTTFFTLPEANLATGETCDLTTGLLYTGTAANPTASGTTQSQQACTLAARAKLGSYAAGAAYYDAQIASVNTDLGLVQRIGDQEINTPKLDIQITPKERLSLLYHRLRWDSPGGVQTAATAFYGVDTWGNDFVKLDYGLTKLESQITGNISNEIGYQYGRELDYETQQPYSAYTQNNLVGNTGNVPYVNLATSSGFNLGSPYYSYRLAYPDERKWQVFDTAYWVKGNHTIKFGVDLLHNYDLINNTYESNGDYSYTYIGNYFADLYGKQHSTTANCSTQAPQTATITTNATTGVKTVNSAVGTLPCYTNYYQGYGNPLVSTQTLDYGFFAQDNWKVSPRLTLEFGVRYDYESLPQPNSALTVASGTFVPFNGLTNRPSDKDNVGPRVGFAYDVYGTGKTVLRGGYGLFYGRILNGTIENTYLNTGSPLGQYTTTYLNNTAGAPQFANLTTAGAAPAAPSVYYFDAHMQNPMVHEYDLILQQDLGHSMTFNLSYLGSLGRELPNFLNLNLNPTQSTETITFTGNGPIPNGTVVRVPIYTAYGNTAMFGTGATAFQSITEVTSNINSSYNAMVAEVKTRRFYGIEMDASYTWSHALDFGQNAQTQGTSNNFFDPYMNYRANYGNSNYNVPNRFVSYFLYEFPNIQDGPRWEKLIANNWNFNNSFQMQNGLPYSLNLSGTLAGAKLSGINGAGGVAYIPNGVIPGVAGLGRNTYMLRRDIVDDIRLVKGLPITDRYNLELRADVFNIANHQNVSSVGTTGYTISSAGTLTSTAAFQSTTFGVPATVNSSGFLYTPRNIQISARFTF